MSESRNGEADIERCCIAHRPASVRRVITTAKTPHNTERQRRRRGESNRHEKKEDIGENSSSQRQQQTLIIPPDHPPPCHPDESIPNVFCCFSLKCLCDKATPALWCLSSSLPSTNAKHPDMTSSGAAIILTNVPLCLFVSFSCLSLFLSVLPPCCL